MEPVEIAAGRFQLRPWHAHDVDVVAEALVEKEIARWTPASVDHDARTWLARRAERWESGENASFAVMDAVTGAVLGHISLKDIDLDARSAEIGYWTLAAARGRGVARHGTAAVSRWAFGALDLHRLELRHAVGNIGSCAVARSCGYALEGVLRDCLVVPGIESVDGGGSVGSSEAVAPVGSAGSVAFFEDAHLHARLATDSVVGGAS